MGKKKSAKSARKAAAFEAARKLEALQKEKIRNAMLEEDGDTPRNVLATLPERVCNYQKDELKTRISFASPATMSAPLRDWTLDLCRASMKEMYLQANWGWDDGEKRQELTDRDARYLIAWRKAPESEELEKAAVAEEEKAESARAEIRKAAAEIKGDTPELEEKRRLATSLVRSDRTKVVDPVNHPVSAASKAAAEDGWEPVGYVHFRFIPEGVHVVTYVFELQGEAAVRGRGLGRYMMNLIELISLKVSMQWVMLTVFRINTGAQRFYRERLKYSVDEVSPRDPESTYDILSKAIDPVIKKSKERRHRRTVMDDAKLISSIPADADELRETPAPAAAGGGGGGEGGDEGGDGE